MAKKKEATEAQGALGPQKSGRFLQEVKEEEKIPEIIIKGDKCISCNTNIVNDIAAVKFPCPNCGKYIIIRCSNCRKIVSKYKCPGCGFEGPN
jgi:hypothetical protein